MKMEETMERSFCFTDYPRMSSLRLKSLLNVAGVGLALLLAACTTTLAVAPSPTPQVAPPPTMVPNTPTPVASPTATLLPSLPKPFIPFSPLPTPCMAPANLPVYMKFICQDLFIIGSDRGDESPPHIVRLSSFAIDTFEVSWLWYQGCVADGACNPPHAVRQSWEKDIFPVHSITWEDASKFCRWFGGKRLPTEAEWEAAARGSEMRTYSWGNIWDPKFANTLEGGEGRRVELGAKSYDRSPFGLADMAGNVAEWVADVYAPDYYNDSPNMDPKGPKLSPTQQERVIRGGSFRTNKDSARTSARSKALPSTTRDDLGFRCAMDVK